MLGSQLKNPNQIQSSSMFVRGKNEDFDEIKEQLFKKFIFIFTFIWLVLKN